MDWYRLAHDRLEQGGMPGDDTGSGIATEPGAGLGPLDLAEPGTEPADGPTMGEPGAGPPPSARPDKIKPGPRKSLFRKNVWRIQP
jgi:hypothetical protein